MSVVTTTVKLFDGETTSRVSEAVDVSMRSNKSIQFVRAAHSAGSAILELYISNDLVNWVLYNRLTTNVTNTNVQNDLRTNSLTLSANGSSFAFIPHGDHFNYVRGSLLVNTDGSMTAILSSNDA